MRKIKYQARKDLVKSGILIDENILHPGITATRTERIMNESVSLYKPRILKKILKQNRLIIDPKAYPRAPFSAFLVSGETLF